MSWMAIFINFLNAHLVSTWSMGNLSPKFPPSWSLSDGKEPSMWQLPAEVKCGRKETWICYICTRSGSGPLKQNFNLKTMGKFLLDVCQSLVRPAHSLGRMMEKLERNLFNPKNAQRWRLCCYGILGRTLGKDKKPVPKMITTAADLGWELPSGNRPQWKKKTNPKSRLALNQCQIKYFRSAQWIQVKQSRFKECWNTSFFHKKMLKENILTDAFPFSERRKN